MQEEYREYRRDKRKPHKKNNKSNTFFKKLRLQVIVSSILLFGIYGMNMVSPEIPVNKYIQKAFFYKPNTSGITETLDRIFKSIDIEGKKYEENTDSKNS